MRPESEAPLTRRQLRASEPDASHRSDAAPEVVTAALLHQLAPEPRAEVAVPAPQRRARRRVEQAAAPVVQEQAVEPVADPIVEPAPVTPVAADDVPADDVPEIPLPEEPVDLFIEAARALNFTGETPIADGETRVVSSRGRRGVVSPSPRRTRPSGVRRVATIAASISAFGAVGLIAVGMTTPLTALASADPSAATAGVTIATGIAADGTEEEIQAFVAPAEVQNAQIERSNGYETTTFAELAEVAGINTANAVYQNDPTADIQWPIVLGTSMSSPFGQRWGRLHEGIDFTPGEGAPVQAIAEGTVRIGSYGAYGNNVYIDHVIDGQMITSHYAHMQDDSIRVTDGQKVEVGDVIGLVGNTGRSYGAHLHFELRLPSGTAIDPMPWLQEHAGTHYSAQDEEEAIVADTGDETTDDTVADVAGE
ncbi:M23 family metallopeptidase [Microbacterium marinilacus]|uniref:M23 family metallopeptidase n=1 Tax=Microbacterium marinilacus TaxID=415209 RepID=UPI001C8EB727|nr:M23 family metallopeptidase [Microbacterium marinilacus]MBY0687019.1 peptidoglycan DD-metalloendopeptidase family protein [Microbacterium marinilacus]